ncbi:MAG: hypothetical protein JSR46_05540, partial [Verrucomicrobia bacterium]|nr:hypothetical protein [Verrucomicrobiota bacterium]
MSFISSLPFWTVQFELPQSKKTPAVKVDHIGTYPQYLENHKATLGSGASKTVSVATVLKKSLLGKEEKEGYKDVALSEQAGNKIGQEVELRVLKSLHGDEKAEEVTAEILYAGTHDQYLVTATKLMYGGEARHCLPRMSTALRLRVLVGYGYGLLLLHSKNTIHNDTALRNMLIQFPTEWCNTEDARNLRLARPIFDHDGNTLFNA